MFQHKNVHYPLIQTHRPHVIQNILSKMDNHIGGKGFIHGTKRCKDNVFSHQASKHSYIQMYYP